MKTLSTTVELTSPYGEINVTVDYRWEEGEYGIYCPVIYEMVPIFEVEDEPEYISDARKYLAENWNIAIREVEMILLEY